MQGGQHYNHFAQTGGNFLVQKIREQAAGDFFEAFGPDDDIMQLSRLAAPRDVWVLSNTWATTGSSWPTPIPTAFRSSIWQVIS